jgi:SAM-dependent methyltransferase
MKRYDPESDFLGRLSESSLIDRITFIKRTFSRVLLLGSFSPSFLTDMEALGHGAGKIIHITHMTSDALMDHMVEATSWNSQDLILSNLSLQWVNDLPGVLWQIRNLLKADGLFLSAFLGGDTLKELKTSFCQGELELYGGASPRVIPMIDLYSASQLLLRADFKLPVADRDVIAVTYPNLTKLMHDLRAMGQTNVMHSRHKSMSSRKLFQRVEEIYAQNFSLDDGYLVATFEMIYLTGWSYHESQQKALKPGSAQLSLKHGIENMSDE